MKEADRVYWANLMYEDDGIPKGAVLSNQSLSYMAEAWIEAHKSAILKADLGMGAPLSVGEEDSSMDEIQAYINVLKFIIEEQGITADFFAELCTWADDSDLFC